MGRGAGNVISWYNTAAAGWLGRVVRVDKMKYAYHGRNGNCVEFVGESQLGCCTSQTEMVFVDRRLFLLFSVGARALGMRMRARVHVNI